MLDNALRWIMWWERLGSSDINKQRAVWNEGSKRESAHGQQVQNVLTSTDEVTIVGLTSSRKPSHQIAVSKEFFIIPWIVWWLFGSNSRGCNEYNAFGLWQDNCKSLAICNTANKVLIQFNLKLELKGISWLHQATVINYLLKHSCNYEIQCLTALYYEPLWMPDLRLFWEGGLLLFSMNECCFCQNNAQAW